MQSFKEFLRCLKNKDVVWALEAMQKIIEVYHNKAIDTLKLVWTLPNQANICLHNSTSANF